MANDSGTESHGPADAGEAKPTADRLEESFERRLAALVDAARRVRQGTDADAIRDLRVATRRLTAALRVWRGIVPVEARKVAARRLRRLRRRLGRARELEVHVALLEERLPAQGAGPRAAAASMLLRLKGRLARRRRAASRRTGRGRIRRLLRSLDRAGDGLRRRFAQDPRAVEGAFAVEHETAEAARSAAREAAAAPEDMRLHAARVLVKKWRYTLECLDETLGGVPPKGVRALRQLQDALGEINDRAMLWDAIMRFTAEPDDQSVPDSLQPLLERLERERHRAVARFQRLAVALDHVRDSAPRTVPSGAGTIPAPADGRPAGERMSSAPTGTGAMPLDVRDASRAPQASPSGTGSEDARDRRWERMASWLEKNRRED